MPPSQLQNIEALELPVLGQTYTPGLPVETFTFTVHVMHFPPFSAHILIHFIYNRTAKTTKADLHEKLKGYGRPTRGNRTQMLERLREFSNDQDEWLRYATLHARA
jgi:hypothetical protein